MTVTYRRKSISTGHQKNISVSLEALSEENCPNSDANKYHLLFTEFEVDIRCPVSSHLYL